MDIRIVYFLAVLGFVQCKLINLKCDGIKKLINGHNSRRLQLAQGKVPGQPAASKMNLMIWDEELAAKAARWAARNKYGHNPDSTIPSNRYTTGENIYQSVTTNQNFELDLEMPMAAWFDEYKDFRYKTLESSDFSNDVPAVGHYTQMAWSDSIYLGCAVSQYKKNGWKYFFVVCNYGPGGNYIDRFPYESGRASGRVTCGTNNCSRLYGNSC